MHRSLIVAGAVALSVGVELAFDRAEIAAGRDR